MNYINNLNQRFFEVFKSWEFWSSILLYSTTLINYTPVLIMLLFLFPFFIYLKVDKIDVIDFIKQSFQESRKIYLLIFIFLFGLLNSIYHHFHEGVFSVLKGPYIILPLLWFCSFIVNDKILKYLIIFTLIETLICFLEYFYGVNSFNTSMPKYENFTSYNLLCVTRVYGLGYTPSILSEKIFIALLLIDFLLYNGKKSFLLKLLFYFGLIITFTRTVLIGFYIYLFVQLIIILFTKEKSIKRKVINYNILFILIVYLSSFSSIKFFKEQFTRGGKTEKTSGRILIDYSNVQMKDDKYFYHDEISNKTYEIKKGQKVIEVQKLINKLKLNKIEMSGRSEIWSMYLLYIKDHLFFGNGSKSIKIGKYHAHNSFIALIAINGIIISIFYFLFIFLNLNKKNFIFIMGLCTMGLGQYAFFWPISYVDVVLFAILLNSSKILESIEKIRLSISK